MNKKYLLLSALGHSLVVAAIAFPAQASRSPADAMTCQDSIDQELLPFRAQVRSIWVKDNLFMYAEVARLFSHQLLDKDPQLRAKIEDFKQGKPSPTASELSSLLTAKADQLAGFSDSLAWRYGTAQNAKWFKWHYPVIHVGELASHKVFFSIPVEVGDYQLNVELGPTSSEEDAQVLVSASRIISLRTGVSLPHTDMFSPEYRSEKDYLTRKDSTVPARCRTSLYPRYAGLDLSPVALNPGRELKDQPSSRGIGEGHWITGFPTSEYSGGRGGSSQGGGSQAAGQAAPGTDAPQVPAPAPAPEVSADVPPSTN